MGATSVSRGDVDELSDYLVTSGASSTPLHVDIWDADSLLHVGVAEVDLRACIRSSPVVEASSVTLELDVLGGGNDDFDGGGGGGSSGRNAAASSDAKLKGHLLLRCFNVGWPIDVDESHMRQLRAAGGPDAAAVGRVAFLTTSSGVGGGGGSSSNNRLVASTSGVEGVINDSKIKSNDKEISLVPSLLDKYRVLGQSAEEKENEGQMDKSGVADRKVERLKKVG